MKAATAACSCLAVVPNGASPQLAEPRRDRNLGAVPKITDVTRTDSFYPLAANVRTAEQALVKPNFAARSSRPVGAMPVVLDSAILIDATNGLGAPVQSFEAVQRPPALNLDAIAIERVSEAASEPAAAKDAFNRSITSINADDGADAMHGADKTHPAACVACRQLSAGFEMFYFARARGHEHREPAASAAEDRPAETLSTEYNMLYFARTGGGEYRESVTTPVVEKPAEALSTQVNMPNSSRASADEHLEAETITGAKMPDEPLSVKVDASYFARAAENGHREPAAMPVADMPDGSEGARASSNAQRLVDNIVAGGETRTMGEPDRPLSLVGAQVQSLQQALSRTYQTNPTLMARRAELRGLDNSVALERSAGNLQVSAASTFSQEVHTTRPLGGRGRNLRSNVDFSKILYAGGRIRNATRSAQTRVLAGRAELRATEGNILTEAVAAYADVLRDREIRDLNESQVRILMANLESTRDRFRVRDLTLTDVAQSETRLEVAKSNLVTAEGRLRASEENFERVVGARAGNLDPLPPLPPLPLSSELAAETALANNASIAAFASRARAADYDVAVSRASRLPTLSVVSSVDNDNALGTANSASGLPSGTVPNSETNIVAGFSLRIPLYQGGGASARVRQNEEIRSQYIEEAIAVERLVLSDARTAFSIWRTATISISFNEQAVASSGKALESVKFEQTVGARSILDVLNAEQEFLNSKIALTSARRDAYVAAFDLLNSMGASEAADLNFPANPLYDPKVNYRKYSDTWSDWNDGKRRPPASTRNAPEEIDSPLTRLNNGTLEEIERDD